MGRKTVLGRNSSRSAVWLAILFCAALWGGLGAREASAQTRLKFIAWNYQEETVKQILSQFEAENPDIKVDMEVIPSSQFAAKIQLMKNANAPFDALYVFDHVLSQWAKWLEPLDGYDGAAQLEQTMLPLARQS